MELHWLYWLEVAISATRTPGPIALTYALCVIQLHNDDLGIKKSSSLAFKRHRPWVTVIHGAEVGHFSQVWSSIPC